MNIIQIIDRMHLAGAQTMCEHLCNELIEQGHRVTLVSFYNYRSSITERLSNRGINIVYLDKKSGFDFSIVLKLRRIIKEINPEVIHTHLGAFIYVVFSNFGLKKKRHIHTVHSLAQKEVSGIRKVVQRLYFRRKKAVPVALSDVVQQSIVDFYKIKAEDVPVILNGIEFKNCIPKKSYEIKDSFLIVHIGRFSIEKNHLGLLKAFKIFHSIYPETKLCLIGDGEKRLEAEEFVSENKLNDVVEFVGVQNNVYPFLNAADIFVLPSLYEGIPVTLVEAMGTGLPIVATRVGGIPDMLENEVNALLCDVDEKKIAECFTRYYLDESLRERHGKAALIESNRFSSKEMVEKYLNVYIK